MAKTKAAVIRLRGVRHNNLKNFDLDLPLKRLIVITGLSGSGKSSLAFDTLYAEGQRRYIETFSPYARQFFDRMDKPRVDRIEGIPPAIAIEQRNTVRSTRSTVGTMTELCEHMKLLWPHVARLHCRQCGQPVRKDTPQAIWETVNTEGRVQKAECRVQTAESLRVRQDGSGQREVLVTFDLPLTEKLSLEESLALVARQGYQRLLVDGQLVRVDEARGHAPFRMRQSMLCVVQDRLRLAPASRARFIEACEQAYHFGKGRLAVHELEATASSFAICHSSFFSQGLHCARCDLHYAEPSPALFSFNHPIGACPACKGFGRVISIDYQLAIPDRSKSLRDGAVKPWQSGMSADCQKDLLKFCRAMDIPVDVPFAKLPEEHQRWVLEGDREYGTDEEHEWPRAWYGVKGYFRWLESKAYKMHVRVMLSRYRAYAPCPECGGARLKPEALRYTMDDLRLTPRPPTKGAGPFDGAPKRSLNLADFYALPVRDSLVLIEALARSTGRKHRGVGSVDPLKLVLDEVRARLRYLDEIGLGYLTLDRPTRTLSGGETERVNLTTCLGTRLVNTLFVLDEPSVGLHPRDTGRLTGILQQLRDAGNTVVVVEHERSVMEAADQIVDLGPGHGADGGQLVFQGTFAQARRDPRSLTGQYLSGRKRIELTKRRPGPLSKTENRKPKTEASPKTENRKATRGHARVSEFGLASDVGLRTSDFPTLGLRHASRHNLHDVSVDIPLNRFVCVSGVSGSGKSTLVREVLLPALQARLGTDADPVKASDRLDADAPGSEEQADAALRNPHAALLTGFEHLDQIVLVDQSILGKTPRSNPAVYIGAFDDIREFFAQSDQARQRGLNASAFSFNSAQGQCERCRGAGFEKIEMQFLSDVFIRCPDCDGRRYREHILEVRVQVAECRSAAARSPKSKVLHSATCPANAVIRTPQSALHGWSIADVLEATVDEAVGFLGGFADSKPAQRAAASLAWLQRVGLGYLALGQPINTLSGGESQRLKLVRHLAEAKGTMTNDECRMTSETRNRKPEYAEAAHSDFGFDSSSVIRHPSLKRTLFLLDEPTTGLHFDDVRVLLEVFQRLVDAGHSLLVIEHNLDVLKCADWIIDLGPEAGDAGGRVVAVGTPEQVAACPESHTGRFLKPYLVPSA